MCVVLNFLVVYSQVYTIDFGTTNALYICNPPIYTLSGNNQCVDSVNFLTPVGKGIVYTTTTTGTNGLDCRNHLALVNPGFSFLGSGSELQLRNAGGGATPLNPARLTVKNFPGGTRFGIIFNFALIGRSGSFYFRCGNGEAYGDTTYMLGRDSSSAVVVKFNDENPAINNPYIGYCNKADNLQWPNVPSYSWQQGTSFNPNQKHEVAIFFNNSAVPVTYSYLGSRTLSPSSYDVYVDSLLDASNIFDDFFQNGRMINSFMFGGGSSFCANGGPYLGDTLIVDNIRFSTDIVDFSLPVHLSSFNASLKPDKKVLLRWRDETPDNSQSFVVEYSSDGRHFSAIGVVPERDNTNDYSFVYAPKDCGTLFFRLSFEGKYSSIKAVNVLCDVSMMSTENGIHIETKYPGTFRLVNMQGQTLVTKTINSGIYSIPLSVPSGIYLACFTSQSGNFFNQKLFLK